MRSIRLSVGTRFVVVLSVLVVLIAAVAAVGVHGTRGVQGALHDHVIRSAAAADAAGDLTRNLGLAATLAVEARNARAAQRARLQARLARISPAVHVATAGLRTLYEGDPAPTRQVEQIAAAWERFQAMPGNGAGASPRELYAAAAIADRLADAESRRMREADARTDRSNARDLWLLLGAVGVALLAALAMAVWLIRAIVPRVREYSRFAARFADGDMSQRLQPRGRDELTDLGHALNEMAQRRAAVRSYEDAQGEFTSALQLTQSEEEAHDLLKRQLERSIASSTATVLNRNNSADRLQATTALPPDSPLPDRLAGAEPRSCLAVRYARGHEEGPDVDPLVSCEICGKTPDRSTCRPLLVGGEVIGSVLVQHQRSLERAERSVITDSVTQAAPVLANLRNLALAEFRAATDALTGLPNNRAARDALKRLVAHAARFETPLAAALLDLDHFKQINDEYGHGPGDEVLAAVGAVLRSTVRGGDVAARYGGEEFLLLLPETDRAGALVVAEKIRQAVSTISVPSVDRSITASVGVAVLPEDGGDAETLVRHADRALYAAKSSGRDRVVDFATNLLAAQEQRAGAVGAVPV